MKLKTFLYLSSLSASISLSQAAVVFCEDFESPTLGFNAFSNLATGTQTFDQEATISGTSLWLVNQWDGFDRASWNGNTQGTDNHTAASSGNQYIQLQDSGTSAATISFTFDTIAGQDYQFTFDYGAIDTSVHTGVSVAYTIDGTASSVTFNTIDGQIPWMTESGGFTASGTSTTISFTGQSVGGGFYGTSIDNIVVIPEPSSVALLLLSGLALITRRKR